MKQKKAKKIKHLVIRWRFLYSFFLKSLFVFLILYALLWYIFLPNTQYQIQQLMIRLKYPNGTVDIPLHLRKPYTYTKDANTTPPIGIYTWSLSSNSITERYSMPRDEHTYGAVMKDSYIYFSGTKELIRYNLETNTAETVYTVSKPDYVIQSVISVDDKGVYIVERLSHGQLNSNLYLLRINPVLKSSEQVYVYPPSIYENISEYFESDGRQYIVTSGGDGCGGSSSIREIYKTTTKDVYTFGEGCNVLPRFIDILPDKKHVLAAAILTDKENEDLNYCHYDVLYTIDIQTKNIDPVFDMKKLNSCIQTIDYDHVTNRVYGFSDGKIYIIDVAKKNLEKTLSFDEKHYANWHTFSNLLTGYIYDLKKLRVVNMPDMNSKDMEWNYIKMQSRMPNIVGIKDNTVIISAE